MSELDNQVAGAERGGLGADSPGQPEGAVRMRRPFIVSTVLFAMIVVAFVLPFGTVSCEGPAVKFTGYQLATWRVPETTPPATTDDGKNLKDEVENHASFWALLTLGAAVAGALLGLTGRRGGGIAASAGLFGVFLLVAASEPLSFGGPDVSFDEGFELVALLYVTVAIWHAALAFRRRWSDSRAGPLDSAVTRHSGSPVR